MKPVLLIICILFVLVGCKETETITDTVEVEVPAEVPKMSHDYLVTVPAIRKDEYNRLNSFRLEVTNKFLTLFEVYPVNVDGSLCEKPIGANVYSPDEKATYLHVGDLEEICGGNEYFSEINRNFIVRASSDHILTENQDETDAVLVSNTDLLVSEISYTYNPHSIDLFEYVNHLNSNSGILNINYPRSYWYNDRGLEFKTLTFQVPEAGVYELKIFHKNDTYVCTSDDLLCDLLGNALALEVEATANSEGELVVHTHDEFGNLLNVSNDFSIKIKHKDGLNITDFQLNDCEPLHLGVYLHCPFSDDFGVTMVNKIPELDVLSFEPIEVSLNSNDILLGEVEVINNKLTTTLYSPRISFSLLTNYEGSLDVLLNGLNVILEYEEDGETYSEPLSYVSYFNTNRIFSLELNRNIEPGSKSKIVVKADFEQFSDAIGETIQLKVNKFWSRNSYNDDEPVYINQAFSNIITIVE